MNYAGSVKSKVNSKYIHLHLRRDDKNISFNLSKKEKAILMFRRLKLEPHQVIGIESHNFEQIRIEVKPDVDIDRPPIKTTVAMQIRAGLKVMPMMELKRTTRVKVCWVPSDVPNQAIIDTLSIFGKVSGQPTDLFFELTEEETKDNDLYGLRGIKSGERAVEIEIIKNIPSYVKIAGKRARIWYPGQNFTCGRCYKSFRSCPGKADRRECQRLKGKERDFEEFWQEIVSLQPRKQRMSNSDEFGTDTVDLARVPDEVEKEEFIKWFKETADIEITADNLTHSGYRGTWRLSGVTSEEIMKTVVERLHGAKIRGKPILALPIKTNTPIKTKVTDMEPRPELMDQDPSTQAAMSDGNESAAERTARLKREAEDTRLSVERERQRLAAVQQQQQPAPGVQPASQPAEQQQQQPAAPPPLPQREPRQRDSDKRDPQAAALSGGEQGSEEAVSTEAGETVKDGGPERQRALASKGPVEGGLGDSTSVDTRVSSTNNPLINTARMFGQKFGLLKKQGNVKINTDNSVQEPLAPASQPASSRVLAEETPAPASASQPSIVPDTPFHQNTSSPTLQERHKHSDGKNLTIGSEDEIFGATKVQFSPSVLAPIKFSSEFGIAVQETFSARKNSTSTPATINLAKRKRIVISSPEGSSYSDESRVEDSPGKEQPQQAAESAPAAPETPKQTEPPKDVPTTARTKGQKNKERKNRKKLAKKMKEF